MVTIFLFQIPTLYFSNSFYYKRINIFHRFLLYKDQLEAIIKVIQKHSGKAGTVERVVVASEGIAFDHAKMIQYAIERLRNKIEYTDIAFNLMPELFTLSELQQVYEVTLGKELLSPAFRRKIKDMVTETNQSTKDAGHRPAKLFKFNPNWQFL